MTHRLARAAAGQAVTVCQLHGDPQPRNFILSERKLVGLDATRRGRGCAQFDLARFVSRLMYNFGDTTVKNGRVYRWLSQSDWAALERGYGQPLAEDPVLRLFLVRQMLSDWVALPADRSARSHGEQLRAERNVEMFEMLKHLEEAQPQ